MKRRSLEREHVTEIRLWVPGLAVVGIACVREATGLSFSPPFRG